MRSLSAYATTFTAAAAIGIAIVSPASASPAPSSGAGRAPAGGDDCVVHVADNARVNCFDTFTKAIADATGGRIVDAPRDGRSALADSGLGRRLDALPEAGPGIVIGIEYDNAEYDGQYRIYSSGSGCDNDDDVEWKVDSLGSFNDMITSFRNYADCQANHFEHIDFGGASTGWLDSTSNIGEAMNDQSSSIQWR
ncbi:hypothetical protein GCM10022254_61110 [Actinomadura meridiana]|uniref:Secreted protein n=1 Tax=Actinomadura meridiana TaxID=559626 RepID=A0ABP8CIK0_9ACTN